MSCELKACVADAQRRGCKSYALMSCELMIQNFFMEKLSCKSYALMSCEGKDRLNKFYSGVLQVICADEL